MRRSSAEAAETRDKIVQTASRLFRQKGINGIGVAELMQQAGLTHGGFYKHFSSKSALVAEACHRALGQGRERLAAAADQAAPDAVLVAIVDSYLSTRHRDHPEHGCAIAALAAEAIREGGEAKEAMASGVQALIELIARHLPGTDPDAAEQRAAAVVAAMVGALTLSRTIADPALSEAVLRNTRELILASVATEVGGAEESGAPSRT